MGADALYGRSASLCGSDADVGCAVPGNGINRYANSPVHQLVGTSLGDKAPLESVGGHDADQTLVDSEHAVGYWSRIGECCPLPSYRILVAGQSGIVHAGGV